MKVITLTKRSLYLLMVFTAIMMTVHILHTQHFLSRATETQAVVVEPAASLLFNAATVRFITGHSTVLDAELTTLEPLKAGEKINIQYNQIIPAQVRLKSYTGAWLSTLTDAAVLILAAIALLAINYFSSWRQKRVKKLRNKGHLIYTRFKGVEKLKNTDDEGRHSYRIVSAWKDPKTGQEYQFRSKQLWNNPSDYIMDQTISVIVDVKNKRRYLMDINFLPDNLF